MIEKLKTELKVAEVTLVRNQEGKPRLITFIRNGEEFRFSNDKDETLLNFIESILKKFDKTPVKKSKPIVEAAPEEVKKKDVAHAKKTKK